tara:strand:+ start:701 stop:907 length:207 start_codon:yes stop_codon:yes gene_type:complete
MSIVFFGVGFVLFSTYLIFLIWNVIYNGNKQQEENYPTLQDDVIDMDGIGNQGRFPIEISKRKKVKNR